MSLKELTEQQLKEMSMIEMAHKVLESRREPISFQEIFDEIAEVLGLTEEEVKEKIAQFYTDLNIDGRFMSVGNNRWGLRVWFPVDQIDEEAAVPKKAKKKKAKKAVMEDDDFDEYEDLEDEDDFDLELEDEEEELDDEEIEDEELEEFEDEEFDDDILDEDEFLEDEDEEDL